MSAKDATSLAAAAAAEAADDSKRRFFPRIKHLLSPDWEYFLQGVLNALESTEAPHSPNASHKQSNAWFKAFHAIYGGIAADCSIPTGKNRYHKFKDKIVEIWVAMEAEDSHPLKDVAMRQLSTYRRACDAKSIDVPDSPRKGKRSASGVSGRPTKKMALGGVVPFVWAHLEEGKVLNESIPEPLQSLIHLRSLASELHSPDNASIEDQYQSNLNIFLETSIVDKSAEELFAHAQAIAVLYRCSKRLGKNAEAKAIQFAYTNTMNAYGAALAGANAAQV